MLRYINPARQCEIASDTNPRNYGRTTRSEAAQILLAKIHSRLYLHKSKIK